MRLKSLWAAFLICLLSMPSSFAVNHMTVSPLIYKHLQRIDDRVSKKQFSEAQEDCVNLLNKKSLNSYEKSIIHQMLAAIYIRQENYVQASESFQKVLLFEALPKQNLINIHYSLAQLYMQQESYDKAIDHFNFWLEGNTKPNYEAWQFLASIYVAKEKYIEAVKPAEKALSLSKEENEQLYQLLLGLYQRTNNNKKAVQLLRNMIEIFPQNKEYWKQLVYMLNVEGEEKLALAILDLAYINNILNNEDELIHLAQLHLFHQNPLRAAFILELAINQGSINPTADLFQLLSSAWLNAKEYEKSLLSLKQAAMLSGTGEVHFQLAQAYSGLQRWEEVIAALEKALLDKEFKNTGKCHLLMGVAYIELEKYAQAQVFFEKSIQEGQAVKEASAWLVYLKQRMAEQDDRK